MYNSRFSIIFLLFAAAFLVSFSGCTDEAQSMDNDEEEEEVVPATPVEAGGVTTGNARRFFGGTATLEAEEEAMVVARTSGLVEEILVEEGDYVRAGQILARLDHGQLSVELAQAEATLRRMESDLARNSDLYEKQLISTEEFERVKFDHAAQVAATDRVKLNLTYANITAPIGGVISQRLIKVGNLVNQNASAFQVTDFSPLLAILHVPERELQAIRVGQLAKLTSDAFPGQSFKGNVDRISPVVDPATGTFKVTLAIKSPNNTLKPGMFGRINITIDVHENVMMIPRQAVLTEDGVTSAFIIQDDTLALRSTIVTGYEDGNLVEVLSGITLDHTIVTTGQNSLRDSATVKIVSH